MSRNQVQLGGRGRRGSGGELGHLRYSGDIQSDTEDCLGSKQRMWRMRLKKF